MDLDPVMWAIIILVVTVLAGGVLLWSTKPKKKIEYPRK